MKLTDIIKEEMKKKEWVSILKKKLDTENWVINDPKIFRGRKRDTKPVKEKKTTRGRIPSDTNKLIFDIINCYHFICYPQFPPRDRVRFGTTDKSFAEHFTGESGKIYVIFPHKNATVYHRRSDPRHELKNAKNYLKYFRKYLESWKEKYGDEKWPSKKVKNLCNKFLNMVKNQEVNKKLLRQFGCPEEAFGFAKSIDIHFEDKSPRSAPRPGTDWHTYLRDFFKMIKWYFNFLEAGYPNKKGSEDEVVFQGKYLQVENDIYTNLISEYPGEYA